METLVGKVTKEYKSLPRGGYLVETSVGYIQVGSPPETIKDTMNLERSTPQIFIVPNLFFHMQKGISVAELEFPIYYNHFLRQKKTYIVCTHQQREQLLTVLNESIFGPRIVDLRSEYVNSDETYGYPDMVAEMEYFRGNRKLEDLVQFVIFKDNIVRFNNVTILKTSEGDFNIKDTDWNLNVQLPGDIGFHIIYETGAKPVSPYEPPLLGITCLGPSHGFDVEDNTSGFLLWIQHKGIMVDPPVNSTEWLRQSNVNPKLISSIILTHTHADHDAGTFQKILEEDRITVYSTETVMHSFINKYHALTQIPVKELFTLFEFVPLVVGRSYIINGAEFHFSYALHSIPSLSFEFTYEDQSFLYSSDHLNDPVKHKELYDLGVLTETRYKDLTDFPWHHKIIYHEAGIPPLHTRIEYLRSLPKKIQSKITVYHIASRDMPSDTKLTLAKFGIENTLYPPVTPPPHEEAVRILDVLSNIDIFRDFPISKAKEFLGIVVKEVFSEGSVIIEKDTPGDKFFIIALGNVRVEGLKNTNTNKDGDDATKHYGSYEYFGETALISNQMRSARVIAQTEVTALTIERTHFLNFIKDSNLRDRFAFLMRNRERGTWQLLSSSRFFQVTTSAQKTQLELIMKANEYPADFKFIEEEKIFQKAYIIDSGSIAVKEKGKVIETLCSGDFFGEIYMLQKESPSSYSFVSTTRIKLYEIEREDMVEYVRNNPGVYMRLNYVYGA